jgi:hypothetical protein
VTNPEKRRRLPSRFALIALVCGLVGAALLIVGGITMNQPFYWGFGCVVMIWSPLAYRFWKSKISPPS